MKSNLDIASQNSQDTSDNATARPLRPIDAALFKDVPVVLRARLGDVTLSIEELLNLKAGSLLQLGASLSDPVELWLNESLIAAGELVAVDDHFGVRITEIARG